MPCLFNPIQGLRWVHLASAFPACLEKNNNPPKCILPADNNLVTGSGHAPNAVSWLKTDGNGTFSVQLYCVDCLIYPFNEWLFPMAVFSRLVPTLITCYLVQTAGALIFIPFQNGLFYDITGTIGFLTSTFVSLFYESIKVWRIHSESINTLLISRGLSGRKSANIYFGNVINSTVVTQWCISNLGDSPRIQSTIGLIYFVTAPFSIFHWGVL